MRLRKRLTKIFIVTVVCTMATFTVTVVRNVGVFLIFVGIAHQPGLFARDERG
jgi:hypothetical protein